MTISDFVQVDVSRDSVRPTREGYGRAVALGYHAYFPESYRLYSSVDEMTDDGFPVYHPLYRMAAVAFGQLPRPTDILIGRLPAPHTHTLEMTILSAVEGQHIKFKCARPTDGTVVEVDYTILAAATTTTVATAVEALVEAIAGVDSSASVAVITITPTTPGNVLFFYDMENVALEDVTADAGYDTELTALLDATPPEASWYAVGIDIASKPNIDDVAAWIEARVLSFHPLVIDTQEKTGGSTVGAGLKTLGYTRTLPHWHPHLHEYYNFGLVGKVLPLDAGSATWALKQVTGVSAPMLTTSQKTALDAAGLNYFTALKGLKVSDGPDGGGQTPSGEFFDIIHGSDWFTDELQTEVFGYMASKDKVPYTDVTKDEIEALALAVGERGVARNLFVPGTLSCVAPLAASISTIDKAARAYGNVVFAARLAGAAHKFRFRVNLSL